ncbi:uncharacterized protein LOC127734587 isoform X3 [Mytilus californianus]|uniref:uncharacterized protein LOC127734587 isoform X3 n=1 Tax=Mytilus californianus TaxID=6549 RepID=UPI002246A8B0|nr:uncharacterized protein LOC127734587 isoform X3 [Mytilus californianus]
MASPESEDEKWPDISSENRIKHEILFYSQGPVDGYLIGEEARDLFLHSRLPITVLSKIWNLADVSNDNLLNVHEFVLCMHLIQEVLKGRKPPGDLPENLKPKMSAPVDLPAITSIEREAYVKVFQTVDDKRKGYLEALEVRPLFQASMLRPEILAKVWDLSDINKDGVLDSDEWTIACHLIRLIKQGNELDGSVNPFICHPDKISPISLQARKSRVSKYEQHKQRLMSLKEKRKNQSLQEKKRLDLLKEKVNIEKELCGLLQNTGNCPLTADEILNLNTRNTEDIDKLEEIVSRLKKEHEKVRQETVKVILGEQKLQDEIRRIKYDTDELNKRLGTKHKKATKDPDPFHQLYEQRKEERKKSNLSEGEEPEVHYPFKISPFDKEALSWKSIKGSDVFLSNHLVDNNNSKQSIENEIVIENLHEFSDKFIESWSSRKPSVEMEKSEEEDPVFMNVDVKPEEYNQWLGAGWKDEQVLSSDNPQFLRLHKKLVDLKKEMQKLNGEVGGRLMFRNPSDYLARKKEKEEEEQKEKSRFARRSKSSTDKDYVAKRRSYVIEKDDSDFKERKSKRGSYTFDHSYDTETKTKVEKPQRRSLKSAESHIPKPVTKSESLKKTRAPQPPSTNQTSERPKSPAPQPPAVNETQQETKKSPESVKSASIEPLIELPVKSESPISTPRESQVEDTHIISQVNSPRETQSETLNKHDQSSALSREPLISVETTSKTGAPGKPNRPPRKKKEVAPQPTVPVKTIQVTDDLNTNKIQVSEDILDKTKVSEIVSDQGDNISSEDKEARLQIHNNQISQQEEKIVEEESYIVESGTYTFRQVQIVNPDVVSTELSTADKNSDFKKVENFEVVSDTQNDKNIKGILKKKEKVIESTKADIIVKESYTGVNTSQGNYMTDDLVDFNEGYGDITQSEKSLPDHLADTISLTSLTSLESVPPPLPDSTPPFLPDIPPPTPVLSRKIEVRKPDIQFEQNTNLAMMEAVEVEEEIMEIQSSSQVQSEAPSTRDEVISPHSQKVAELRDDFFGISKSPPPAEATALTDMDVYLNDLQLEAKTKELEVEVDSDLSDTEEDKIGFEAIFTPGDGETGTLPTSLDDEDHEIHLISYNTTSLRSPESQTDSAFEDMASSMHSNDPDNSNQFSLSSTLEDFPDGFVVKETIREVQTEYVESDPGSMSPPESSPRKPQSMTSPPVNRDSSSFVTKANKFSSIINEPPKIHIRANTKEMSDAHIQEVDAHRKAVIQNSTVKRKNVGWSDEEAPSNPSIEVNTASNSWRENTKSVNGINWEEKPEKVDLYSKNIVEESDTSEIVDRESIADLSSTRKQWETFCRSTSNEPIKPQAKNISPAKRWEVKLPYKSDPQPAITTPRSESPDRMSDTDVDPYASESAIDREIRLANEREEMLRKEQEERLELIKRQAESKQNFEKKNNNNSKEFQTMYHEMTEADRGSELQKRETIIQQEILENKEREKALKVRTYQEDSENDANESVIAKEIRLQREREEEVSHQYGNGEPQTNDEDITYEEAIATYQHEGESLIAKELREHREREEDLQKQRNTVHQSTRNTTKVLEQEVPTVQKTTPTQKQQKTPTPTIQKQSFNSFLSSQSPHSQNVQDESEVTKKQAPKKETPIEREIRQARERENELRSQKGLPLLVDNSKAEKVERDSVTEEEEIHYSGRYNSSTNDTPSMRKFASSRLQNELAKQKEREMTYRKEGKIMTTSEEHIETPMKFSEVPTKLTGPVKRNFVIHKGGSGKPLVENGETESKDNITSPEPSKEEPKFRLKSGGAAFSYRESRQHAESKIEKELREMREREEELKKQRRSSGVILDS